MDDPRRTDYAPTATATYADRGAARTGAIRTYWFPSVSSNVVRSLGAYAFFDPLGLGVGLFQPACTQSRHRLGGPLGAGGRVSSLAPQKRSWRSHNRAAPTRTPAPTLDGPRGGGPFPPSDPRVGGAKKPDPPRRMRHGDGRGEAKGESRDHGRPGRWGFDGITTSGICTQDSPSEQLRLLLVISWQRTRKRKGKSLEALFAPPSRLASHSPAQGPPVPALPTSHHLSYLTVLPRPAQAPSSQTVTPSTGATPRSGPMRAACCTQNGVWMS